MVEVYEIYIECFGDPSAGIPASDATVTMEVDMCFKEEIRESLKRCFSEIWDNFPVYVYFPGEYPGGK